MTDDQLYIATSQAYSPSGMTADDEAYLGLPSFANHQSHPNDTRTDMPIPAVPRVPDPSSGGLPGVLHRLGWSTGLRQPRSMRAPFSGATLVRPSMGVHPAEGPVGFSTRTDRLEMAVDALYNQWLPSQRTIQESFTKPATGDAHLEGGG